MEPPSPANKPSTSPKENIADPRLDGDGTEGGDALNRQRLVDVLADFLSDERTHTPLTLSVEGRWGSGKTKFMKLLRARLEGASGLKRRRTVWFNPWRCQTHEELWAAFALEVLKEARGFLPWPARLWADLRLSWACLDRGRFWRSAGALLARGLAAGAVLVVLFSFAEAGWAPAELLEKMQTPAFWTDFAGVKMGLGVSLVALAQAAWWLRKNGGGLLSRSLEVHLERPDYAARTSFLAEFHRDFVQAMELYTAGRPLVVFIDDLDRCDVPRAAELMHGINLMLGEKAPLIYVIGMDRAKVAAGIAVKNRELLPFLYARELALTNKDDAQELRARGLEYGYEFIEKFIQLPFRLPPCEEPDLRGFIRSRLTQPKPKAPATSGGVSAPPSPAGEIGGQANGPVVAGLSSPAPAGAGSGVGPMPVIPSAAEAGPEPDESFLEEPLLHAARVLAGNPRRIVQLVNLVRLQRRLAPVLGLRVRDGQLAKWTAVALRWPVFLVELEHERGLLAQLIAPGDQALQSSRYKRWNDEADLVGLLRDSGPGGAAAAGYDLTEPGIVDQLLRLGVAVPVAKVGVAAGVEVFK